MRGKGMNMRFTIALMFAATCYPQATVTQNRAATNDIPPTATFASPPASPATGAVYIFTDASAVGTCAGAGTALATCRWSGSVWQAVSGGGSGSFSALSGDATSTATGGATTVTRINGTSLPAYPTALPTPATPTLTVNGTPGSTTYHYVIVANGQLGYSLPSTAAVTTTGTNPLTGINSISVASSAVTESTSRRWRITTNDSNEQRVMSNE